METTQEEKNQQNEQEHWGDCSEKVAREREKERCGKKKEHGLSEREKQRKGEMGKRKYKGNLCRNTQSCS